MKATVLRNELMTESLSVEIIEGKTLLDPFTTIAKEAGTNIALLEITDVESRAEVHRDNIDFFYCLEGEVEFVTGGALVEPFLRQRDDGTENDLEIRAPKIDGGEVHILKKGDMIWIPNGLPHSNRSKTSGRLMVIKIPAREVYPLEDVTGWNK